MYDYLAKIILLGPSGTGKYASVALIFFSTVLHERQYSDGRRSCLLHRFVKNECMAVCKITREGIVNVV